MIFRGNPSCESVRKSCQRRANSAQCHWQRLEAAAATIMNRFKINGGRIKKWWKSRRNIFPKYERLLPMSLDPKWLKWHEKINKIGCVSGKGSYLNICYFEKITLHFCGIVLFLYCIFTKIFYFCFVVAVVHIKSFSSRQCSECDQAGSSDMEADIAMETLPDGTKRSRRQIKEPVKFVPQDVPPEPKKIPIRNTVNDILIVIE